MWSYYQTMLTPDRSTRLRAEAGEVLGQGDVDALNDLAMRGDSSFMPALLAVLEAAPDSPEAVAWLGAGPLEDYVARASEEQRSEVAVLARQHPALQQALSSVYDW